MSTLGGKLRDLHDGCCHYVHATEPDCATIHALRAAARLAYLDAADMFQDRDCEAGWDNWDTAVRSVEEVAELERRLAGAMPTIRSYEAFAQNCLNLQRQAEAERDEAFAAGHAAGLEAAARVAADNACCPCGNVADAIRALGEK